MLQVIVFALLFGIAMALSGEAGQRLAAIFKDINTVIMLGGDLNEFGSLWRILLIGKTIYHVRSCCICQFVKILLLSDLCFAVARLCCLRHTVKTTYRLKR